MRGWMWVADSLVYLAVESLCWEWFSFYACSFEERAYPELRAGRQNHKEWFSGAGGVSALQAGCSPVAFLY